MGWDQGHNVGKKIGFGICKWEGIFMKSHITVSKKHFV
jgi:hypothetical protein